ncbi:GDSL-type esterase/lipase family protein [Vibrio owensii]|uniref:GDSL-type esterase/lipase family protein n=1 Tax=Vibrio owensii TaxID=696485 RepID=UPI004069032A
MFKRFSLPLLALILFSFGVAVGHYKFFPFSALQTIKAVLAPAPAPAPFSQSDRFINHVALFDGVHGSYDVVFLGDSITNAGRWSELFPFEKVANRGISGDTSEGILKRVDQVIALNPARVYLMFGINDIARGTENTEIFSNYKNIISKLQNSGIKVIVQSTLLTDRDDFNTKVNGLNTLLSDHSSRQGVDFIDINHNLAPDGILQNSYDGIHLNADAYLAWRDAIIQAKD